MRIEVRATVQPDSISEFKSSVELHYGVTAECTSRGTWVFTGEPKDMELVVQDFMQLKPLAWKTLA